MATFLQRYHSGEREQVWAELVALGEKVREEPVFSDAREVARETMRRARHNVELIYQRLQALGYTFEYPDAAFVPPSPAVTAQLDTFEREVGAIPLSLRAWCEIVGEVNFVGNHPGLAYYGPSVAASFGGAFPADLGTMLQQLTPEKKASLPQDMQAPLQNLLDSIQKLNASFGDVLKSQAEKDRQRPSAKLHQQQNIPQVLSDPLVVEALHELDPDAYAAWHEDEENEGEPFPLSIAPDVYHKSNISGGAPYDITLPDARADAPLLNELHETLFVPYLRIVFQWGGFPGLEQEQALPETILQTLQAGLLPI
ncbi:MAG: hypothetical protein U0694_15135 [Anaerolineae bacterium]